MARLPLPLQFLAAWLAVWLGRVLQEQVDYLKAENHLLREKMGILGIAVNPGGHWIEQMARNLVDGTDRFLLGKRYVLLDRDPLYTQAFRRILDQAGVKTVRLPAHSPNLNAFAERFVLSTKTECLDRLIPLGETHLRRAVLEYTKHYHEERNHQGLDNELIVPAKAANGVGNVSRRERLGYYREAA